MQLMSPLAGAIILIGITLIWGSTFVVVKETLETLSVPLLLALRFSIAGLALAWVKPLRSVLVPSLVLGVLSFVGFATQTVGLVYTTASKAAFITGLCVILTPLLSAYWFGKRVPVRSFAAALTALVGLGLMTVTGTDGVNAGDLWVLGTALAYALYIIYLGEVARSHSPLVLSAMQLWVMAALSWAWALPNAADIMTLTRPTFLAVLYLAIVATVLTTFFQTVAQRVVAAHVAALIFVLEPVFAAAFAYLLLGERLGFYGWLGAGLVLVAMLVSEAKLPSRRVKPVPVPVPLEGVSSGD